MTETGADAEERTRTWGPGLCSGESALPRRLQGLPGVLPADSTVRDRSRARRMLSRPGWKPSLCFCLEGAWKSPLRPEPAETSAFWAAGEEGHQAHPCPQDGRQAERGAPSPERRLGPGGRWDPDLHPTKRRGHRAGHVESQKLQGPLSYEALPHGIARLTSRSGAHSPRKYRGTSLWAPRREQGVRPCSNTQARRRGQPVHQGQPAEGQPFHAGHVSYLARERNRP